MRIYIPATPFDLGQNKVTARVVHAVTKELLKVMPDEEAEIIEAVAFNAATDASVDLIPRLMEEEPDIHPRRVVISADVPDAWLEMGSGLPTALRLTRDVEWARVACFHVDGWEAEEDVKKAPANDEAFERLTEEDLLWFDITERAGCAEELRATYRV